ncbi:hypothetical protein [Virgisporangium ochraceum]|nr:hypothetical protein [Virgisporangium ochraceum]
MDLARCGDAGRRHRHDRDDRPRPRPAGADPRLEVAARRARQRAVGLLFLYPGLKPFRFRIDGHGLTLRLPDESALARSVGWGSVEAIMLEPRPDGPPRLVLVPAAGVDLGVPAEYRNSVDGRASIILLSTSDVRETPDRIDAALRRYAGDRYPLAG